MNRNKFAKNDYAVKYSTENEADKYVPSRLCMILIVLFVFFTVAINF